MAAIDMPEMVRPRVASKAITLSASNTTASMDLFQITGTVKITGIWGVVTTVLGANHTNGYLRLDDGTNQVTLTADGATLTDAPVGTTVHKEGLAASALTELDSSQCRLMEPAAAGDFAYQHFVVQALYGTDTHIEYRYTTTDTPTSGVITWYCEWIPRTSDGKVEAA